MEKTMKMFEVSGKFIQKGNERKFAKKIEASNYKIKRRHVFIEELKEAKKE